MNHPSAAPASAPVLVLSSSSLSMLGPSVTEDGIVPYWPGPIIHIVPI